MYTVYNTPSGKIAVRRFWITTAGAKPEPDPWLVCADLTMARAALERLGLVPMDRDPDDDPSIVETWL